MKINPKLVLIEIILSTVLFLAVVFSITSFVRYIGLEDLKIKTATLRETATRLRYSVVEMNASVNPTSFLTLDYRLFLDQMEESLVEIETDRMFRRLPVIARTGFDVIREDWEQTRSVLNLEEITAALDLRSDSPFESEMSLSTMLSLTELRNAGTQEYRSELKRAVFLLTALDRRIANYEALLDWTVAEMLDAAEEFRRFQLILAVSIPAFILILALVGIFLFGNDMSRRLVNLDNALSEVASGDFSVRIAMRGQDEFNSLATSINAFTRTLGAKLESFRLIMHDIGQTLGTNISSTQVEENLLRLAMRDTIADGAALYKVGGDAGELILSVSAGRYRPPFAISDLPDSPGEDDIEAILRSRIIQPGVTILGESAVTGEPRIIRNTSERADLDWRRDESDTLFVASIIVVPLQIGSTVFGVLSICSTKTGRYFSDLEFANMQSFGELAAITLDSIYKYADLLEATQLNRELGIAEEIQRDLLPKRLPRLPRGEVAYLSRSIKGLNGDYFDVYPLGNGKTMITICEVAGRGVPAGLVMVMIRTILRLVSTAESDARTIMSRLNRNMTQRIAIENYASVGILVVDDDGDFTFSSAAHYPLQIFRAEGRKYEAVQTEGIPVGIDPNAEYHQVEGRLEANDLVLFHTDGIPESRNRDGGIYGIDKLLKSVEELADGGPEEIVDSLRSDLEYFERDTEQKDDQTAIVLKYRGNDAA